MWNEMFEEYAVLHGLPYESGDDIYGILKAMSWKDLRDMTSKAETCMPIWMFQEWVIRHWNDRQDVVVNNSMSNEDKILAELKKIGDKIDEFCKPIITWNPPDGTVCTPPLPYYYGYNVPCRMETTCYGTELNG